VGGTPEAQVLAANIDYAFIVVSVDINFNINRIERYLTLVYNSDVIPIIVLNKIDLVGDLNPYINGVRAVAGDVDILAVSAEKGTNMDRFESYMSSGKTMVFFGSSGVGKSTITNVLIGDKGQKTSEISSANGKGRHTTSTSQLLVHASGCMVIDTPGLRELQLWCDEEALDKNFQDVIDIMNRCKFSNCSHESEKGCAIQAAISEGTLSHERFNSYRSQYEEVKHVSAIKRQAGRYLARKSKYNKR